MRESTFKSRAIFITVSGERRTFGLAWSNDLLLKHHFDCPPLDVGG